MLSVPLKISLNILNFQALSHFLWSLGVSSLSSSFFFPLFKVLHAPQILTRMSIPPEIISGSLKSGNCSGTLRIVCGIYCTNFRFLVHVVLCTDPTWASNMGLGSCSVSVFPGRILSVCMIVTWTYRLHNSSDKLYFLSIPPTFHTA